MSHDDRAKITLVDIMAVLVAISLVGWFLMSHAPQAQPLLAPSDLSRVKVVGGTLRQISYVAHQYMLDHGVTQAHYADLVGTGTNNYIRNVSPVAGEDYTHLVIAWSATQISISSTALGTITYSQ